MNCLVYTLNIDCTPKYLNYKMTNERQLKEIKIIGLEDIKEAQQTLKDVIVRTPLIKLNKTNGNKKIYLKLENLQPVGSFKLRGASNALLRLPKSALDQGVYTCSAGNFALGLAHTCKQIGVKCTIIVPETAPTIKVEAIQRIGSQIITVSFNTWWSTMVSGCFEGLEGTFIHPVCNYDVISGNGTIGLEIIEDLPEVDTIITPYGGGGLTCGVASAVKNIKPNVEVVACEVETAAPLTAAKSVGHPIMLNNHKPSFVDGMGGKSVFDEMWTMASNLIDKVIVTSLKEICEAVKLLAERNHVIAEGAGAAPIVAAMNEDITGENIVCVVSGGNIDTVKLVQILNGVIPI